MESPKNSNKNVKFYKLQVNEQEIDLIVEKINEQIFRIWVIVGEDIIELKLDESTSKIKILKTQVAKWIVETFNKVDNFMRWENPEERDQQKEYQDTKSALITLLVKYTNQDRKALEVFLAQFSLEEVKNFYQYFKNIVSPKKSKNLTPVVKYDQNSLNEESNLDNKSSEQPAFFDMGTIRGYIKVIINFELLESLSDEELEKEIDQFLSNLRENYLFKWEDKKLVLCSNKDNANFLKKIKDLLVKKGFKVRFAICD